jgi:hypothetical protein
MNTTNLTVFLLILLKCCFICNLESNAQGKTGWAAAPYLAEGNYTDVPVKDKMQQGNWVAGGNITGGLASGPLVKNYSYAATFQVGYLAAKRLVGGIQMSYGADHFQYKGAVAPPSQILAHHHHSLTPEIFGRYYITSYKVKPFVHFSTGYKWLWGAQQKVNERARDGRQTQFTSSVAAGFCWLFKSRWAIEAMYQHQLTPITSITDGNSKTPLRLGLSFFLD